MPEDTPSRTRKLVPKLVPLPPLMAIEDEQLHCVVMAPEINSLDELIVETGGELLLLIDELVPDQSGREFARTGPKEFADWLNDNCVGKLKKWQIQLSLRYAVHYYHDLDNVCLLKELGSLEMAAVQLCQLGRMIERIYVLANAKAVKAGLRNTRTGMADKAKIAEADWKKLEKRVRELMRINKWTKTSACESVAKEFTEGIGLFSYNRGLAKKTIKASYLDRHVFTWQTSLRNRE